MRTMREVFSALAVGKYLTYTSINDKDFFIYLDDDKIVISDNGLNHSPRNIELSNKASDYVYYFPFCVGDEVIRKYMGSDSNLKVKIAHISDYFLYIEYKDSSGNTFSENLRLSDYNCSYKIEAI